MSGTEAHRRAAVPDGGAQQVFAGLPAPVEHGLAGPGAGGDGVDGEVLVALGGQLLPGGIEDRVLQLGAAAAGLRVAGLLLWLSGILPTAVFSPRWDLAETACAGAAPSVAGAG